MKKCVTTYAKTRTQAPFFAILIIEIKFKIKKPTAVRKKKDTVSI